MNTGTQRVITAVGCLLVSFVLLVPAYSAFGDIQDILDDLRGLPFDEFVDASYMQILLRSPELVTSMGLSQTLGTRDDRLDNICYSVRRRDLRSQGRNPRDPRAPTIATLLSYEQQISYDSYSWVLAGWAVEHEYMYHFYPVTHGFSRQNELFRFFEDDQPMETLRNARDYIRRLRLVDDQFDCLIQNLDDSETRGILAPAQMLERAADRIRGIVPGTAEDLSFYTTFATKIRGDRRDQPGRARDLLTQARNAINSSVIPAYQALVVKLDEQIPRAPAMNGVWQLPDGDAFYRARVRHHTTTDLTPDEIHQTGLDEVDRIRGQIRGHFDDLGYPSDETFAELYDRVAVDSGIVPADEIVALNEGFIRAGRGGHHRGLRHRTRNRGHRHRRPGGRILCLRDRLDGSRPGAYYIGNQTDSYRYWMRTIAYHEAVPGHHFQIAIGNEQDVPLFTKGGGFYTAFVEGWALYAEYLAMELGWYDDDVYSELGRLQWELLQGRPPGRRHRAPLEEGGAGNGPSTTTSTRWAPPEQLAAQQIDLYLYYVGYFTAYKTGMMKILELRQHAHGRAGRSLRHQGVPPGRAVCTTGSRFPFSSG